MRSPLTTISESPLLFHWLRKLPENNYAQTKRRIRAWLGPERLPILDLGCGTGEYAHLFPPGDYTGVDLSDRYVAFAQRHRPRHCFERQSGTALSFADGQFRAVLINGVLHHLDDDVCEAVLREARRVLDPRGSLLLIEDIPASRWNLLGRLMHAADRGHHIRRVSDYRERVVGAFDLVRSEEYRSGICDYLLMELSPLQ
jgi:SAM-dependent methyltransferase